MPTLDTPPLAAPGPGEAPPQDRFGLTQSAALIVGSIQTDDGAAGVAGFDVVHTDVGEDLGQRTGPHEPEVTDDVFESPHAIVFDRAENRLHPIKAVLVATMGG